MLFGIFTLQTKPKRPCSIYQILWVRGSNRVIGVCGWYYSDKWRLRGATIVNNSTINNFPFPDLENKKSATLYDKFDYDTSQNTIVNCQL